MKLLIKILILVLCLSAASCSLKRTATTMTAKLSDQGLAAVESEGDLWIAKESILPLVKLLEIMRVSDPENKYVAALMARVYGNVAFGFFEPEMMKAKDKTIWKARVDRYYKNGMDAGLLWLEKRYGKETVQNINKFNKKVGKPNKRDLMPLFWTAFNIGNYINLHKDDIVLVAKAALVDSILNAILASDRTFAHGTPLAFKGAMLASRPKMLGGNPEVAKTLFEEAIRVSGGKYLMNQVLFAQWYAIPLGKKDLAKRLLKEVTTAPEGEIPEQALANSIAKERATILLK